MSSNNNINGGFDSLLNDLNKSTKKPEQSAHTQSNSSAKKPGANQGRQVPSAPKKVVPKRNDDSGTKVFSAVNVPAKKVAQTNNPAPQKSDSTAKKSTASGKLPISKIQNRKPKKNVQYFPEEKTKNKRGKRNSGIFGSVLRFVLYIAMVLVVSVFCAKLIINVANDVFAFLKDDTEITLTIPEGATTKQISKILGENGIVDYPFVFRLYTDAKKDGSKYYTEGYKSGEFTITPSTNYDDLIYLLSNNSATREIVRLTFPEGSTIDEIIDILIKGGVKNTKEQYIDVIENYDFDYQAINELDTDNFKNGRKYRLEGYLFPDTYDFYTDENPVSVINKFLVNFDNKFDASYYETAKKLGLSVDEIITIASLIETESSLTDDRGKISSVFHNRIKNMANYPYLQSDATIQYALPERTKKVTPEDLKYDSPYNTYIYRGLPPSAIANPGLDAITYALYPENTSYYYFVSDGRGRTYFATSLPEHNVNIAKIRNNSQ